MRQSKTISYDDTRDVAIRTISKLIAEGILEDNDDNYFTIQDIIQDEINDVLGLDIDDNFEIKIECKVTPFYIDFLNKEKGFKQDRIGFSSYELAVKWAKTNFDKFSHDMIKTI